MDLHWPCDCTAQSSFLSISLMQHFVHRFSICHSSVRHFPERSQTGVAFPSPSSDTKEGYSCCARRLECKSGQGCLWKLARHLQTLLQWWHKWERTWLLEFATFNDLVLSNTFGRHKASRGWIWHSPNGQHHNQIDYILVRKRFQSGVNSASTQSFPGADTGSDHDLLMITFHFVWKESANHNTLRLKFDLEKLKDPNVLW